MYQALYRKKRPQKFNEVSGQEATLIVLKNALNQDKISHAYMFSGPRGTGKTSIAKIFAKVVNCAQHDNGEPCGKCHNCSQKDPVDIVEFDAASNSSVENIREILENVKYAPTNGRYKVYIIDEVHSLSDKAFQALLKTLEEPPSHVIFILATTEPHKVPLTIISRCQRYEFKRISLKDLVGRMKKVLEEEGIKAENNALELIARVAQGGMRDALSLLDQAISHSNGKVTLDDVIAITGTAGLELLTKTIELIHYKNTSKVLDIVNEVIEGGKEPHFFLEDLLTYYRDIVMYQTIGEEANLEKAMLDETFIALTKKIHSSTIYAIIDVMNEKLREIRFSNQSKVLLELALVRVCRPSVTVDPLLMEELINAVKRELGNGIVINHTQPVKEVATTIVEQPRVLQEESIEKRYEEEKTSDSEQEEDLFSNLSVLDEVETELKGSEETEELPTFLDSNEQNEELPPFLDSNEQNEDLPPFLGDSYGLPEEEFVPTSDGENTTIFIDMIQADIEAGAEYIEVVDKLPENIGKQRNDEQSVNNENFEEKIPNEAAEIFSVLDKSTKEFKMEYLSKEEEFLTALKKKKLPLFKLFTSSEKVWAVSESHMVMEFNPKMNVACGNITKASNQRILKDVFKVVFGRELEVKAYTTDVLKPILDQYRK